MIAASTRRSVSHEIAALVASRSVIYKIAAPVARRSLALMIATQEVRRSAPLLLLALAPLLLRRIAAPVACWSAAIL